MKEKIISKIQENFIYHKIKAGSEISPRENRFLVI